MPARKRRTPLGTQPPVTSETAREVAGTIEAQTEKIEKLEHAIEAHENAIEARAADQEHAVIVQIDDDWLERLDLPLD